MCRFLILLAAVPLFSGCATIISGGPDMVPVDSIPRDAVVKLDGRVVGKTPMTVAVSRRSEGLFTFEKPGYQTARVDRDKIANPWFFPGNLGWILFCPGGIISIPIDLATSNQGKYSTNPMNVKLLPEAAATSTTVGAATVQP